MAFTDPRRFGRVRIPTLADPRGEPPVSLLGPDVLTDVGAGGTLTADEFSLRIRKRGAPVKAILLDQATVSGIGNWVRSGIVSSCFDWIIQRARRQSSRSDIHFLHPL